MRPRAPSGLDDRERRQAGRFRGVHVLRHPAVRQEHEDRLGSRLVASAGRRLLGAHPADERPRSGVGVPQESMSSNADRRRPCDTTLEPACRTRSWPGRRAPRPGRPQQQRQGSLSPRRGPTRPRRSDARPQTLARWRTARGAGGEALTRRLGVRSRAERRWRLPSGASRFRAEPGPWDFSRMFVVKPKRSRASVRFSASRWLMCSITACGPTRSTLEMSSAASSGCTASKATQTAGTNGRAASLLGLARAPSRSRPASPGCRAVRLR